MGSHTRTRPTKPTILPSTYSFVFILGIMCSMYPYAHALIRSLTLPAALRDCYLRGQNYTTRDYVGGLYSWYCEAPIRAQLKGAPTSSNPQRETYYSQLYSSIVEPKLRRQKRQATNRCERKEIRMLTDDERNRFFNALNALKRDRSVDPNKYDALALLHQGVTVFIGHGSSGFAGWHRVFLLMFEAALQEVDPTVCLPYWDSSLDSELPNPEQSYVWSSTFFGEGDQDVQTGPFAGWTTPDGSTLTRSVGRDGQLFTRAAIEAIMSRSTYQEILLGNSNPRFSLEVQHGAVHVFVGGKMEQLNTAAFEPVFFLHHCFVDYIFEKFREKLRISGADPEVYPSDSDNEFHLPTASMGFGNLTQADGYLNSAINSYFYQPSPECSARNPDCGSKYLWCNVTIARCIPVDPATAPSPTTTGPQLAPCPVAKPQAYQNSYCVDGVCDVQRWVYLAVKIISQRPPEFTGYKSYPVHNGGIHRGNDIYGPAENNEIYRFINRDGLFPKRYEKCSVSDGVGRVFISSQGLDYAGWYKESAIVDQRLATALAVAYIAVKDPQISGVSQAILRAHDSCGRICHPACKVFGSNPTRYEDCSGVVELNTQIPLQYSATYSQATLSVFDYHSNANCPSFKPEESVFMTFYCDYHDYLPYVDKALHPPPVPVTTTTPNPTPAPASAPGGSSNECRLTADCTIGVPCQKSNNAQRCSKYMEVHGCLGNCGRYAICNYGTYWLRSCPAGFYFDPQKRECMPGSCQSSPMPTYNVPVRSGLLFGLVPKIAGLLPL